MSVENSVWVMKGRETSGGRLFRADRSEAETDWDHPECIHTVSELEDYIEAVGFLPLFANEVEGFSVEEWTVPGCWWTGDEDTDPWQWREIIARSQKIAYGKFFDKKAGFISLEWLPYFVNNRRSGYDYDARWQDGLSGRREKLIMDFYIGEDSDGDTLWKDERILSTELKKRAGFGKQGEKNFPGILTQLQMETYLVIADFERRKNKKGNEYGMAVSIMFPPEKLWGYEAVTAAYREPPVESWQKIFDHVKEMYEEADDAAVIRIAGKKPEE